MIGNLWLKPIVESALREDIGRYDWTTLGMDLKGDAVARILLKEDAVISGHEAAGMVFEVLDPQIQYRAVIGDAKMGKKGDVIAEVKGNAQALLMGERTALNFLMYLSGIATLTRRYADAIKHTGVWLLDTRKTTPNMRLLQKAATAHGGAKNHRFGLDDGVLIKDTHLDIYGSVKEAVKRLKLKVPHTIKIEVEIRSFEQAKEAVEAGADAILIDNLPVEEVCKIVKAFKHRVFTEVSGNVTIDNIRDYAACGPDGISTSAMVKYARWIDMSMKTGFK